MSPIASFLRGLTSDQTRRAYRRDLRAYFGKGEVSISDVETVSSESIQVFVRSMHEQDFSEATQRRRLAALRSFFDWAVKNGIREHNPARNPSINVFASEEDTPGSSLLTAAQVKQLLDAAGEHDHSAPRDQTLLLTIFYAALRRSEVAALEVEDVRPLGQYWIIDLQSTGSRKGGYVRVPDVLVDAIENMTDVYDLDTGPLWRSLSNRNWGHPLSPDALYKIVRRSAERAELAPVTIDGLRRTGLHLALQGGAPVPVVQAHGRFEDASTTASLHDSEDRTGTLNEDPSDYIDLTLSDIL